MSYAYGSSSNPRFFQVGGDLGISDKLAAEGKPSLFSRLAGGKPDLNTYAGSAPPKLSDADRRAGYMWVNSGTHNYQTNNPESGSTNNSVAIWRKIQPGGGSAAKPSSSSSAAAPPPANTPPARFTPSSDLLSARERAQAFQQGGSVASPNLSLSDGPLYQSIYDSGDSRLADYRNRFIPGLLANSNLQTMEIGEVARWNADRINVAPPALMDQSEIKNLYRYYSRDLNNVG